MLYLLVNLLLVFNSSFFLQYFVYHVIQFHHVVRKYYYIFLVMSFICHYIDMINQVLYCLVSFGSQFVLCSLMFIFCKLLSFVQMSFEKTNVFFKLKYLVLFHFFIYLFLVAVSSVHFFAIQIKHESSPLIVFLGKLYLYHDSIFIKFFSTHSFL